jgi:hypothetical protein
VWRAREFSAPETRAATRAAYLAQTVLAQLANSNDVADSDAGGEGVAERRMGCAFEPFSREVNLLLGLKHR